MLLRITFALCLILHSMAAVSVSGETIVDACWEELEGILKGPEINRSDDRMGYLKRQEQRSRQYRERGLQFYNRFPDDPRRWDWLLRTLELRPRYWADLEQGSRLSSIGRESDATADTAALKQWQEILDKTLRPEFLSSQQVSSEQRARWYLIAMSQIQRRAMTRGTTEWKDVTEFAFTLLAYAAEPVISGGAGNTRCAWGIDQLRLLIRFAQLSVNEQRIIVGVLKSAPNAELQRCVSGFSNILDLYEHPLELRATTLAGQEFDVADWRGKVLLVDIWSTDCKSCVAAMPKLKGIHERYRDRGFEIVAFCIDYERSRLKADEILQKIAPTWPTAWVDLADQQQRSAVVERFGITSVPVYFLLDRSGRLVGTDYVGSEGQVRLDRDIQRLLGVAAKPGAAN